MLRNHIVVVEHGHEREYHGLFSQDEAAVFVTASEQSRPNIAAEAIELARHLPDSGGLVVR